MADPIVLPSLAMLTGGGLLARDYMKRRLQSAEDRYMALYGREEWDASNMDLRIRCLPQDREALIEKFLDRLDDRLRLRAEGSAFFQEEATFEGQRPSFKLHKHFRVKDIISPRRGVYIDLNDAGGIRIIWNHMQADGVGMWSAMRPLFDPNPPLVPYMSVPPPPPILPELLAIPSVTRRLLWRGQLRKHLPKQGNLHKGWIQWDASYIRDIRKQTKKPFNLVSSAVALHKIFERHPHQQSLNVGLTSYFPFLQGRNKYGVFLCRVQRGDAADLSRQLSQQTRHQLLNWGQSAAQAYALGRLPDGPFSQLVGYYRRQIDVLISSLPVGQNQITLGGIPTWISCHPWELTLPYYVLMIGTREDMHISYTSRFPQRKSFLKLTEDYETPIEAESKLWGAAARKQALN